MKQKVKPNRLLFLSATMVFVLASVLIQIQISTAWTDDGNLVQNVSDCGNLNTTNAVYYLNTSVNNSGTCFNIGANNVTLDCQGYLINYSQGGLAYTRGVLSIKNYSTVKNCVIWDGNWTSTDATRYGIFYFAAKNGTIYNNTIVVNSSLGIYLYDGASNNNITKNNVTSTSRVGIYLLAASNNNILTDNMGTSTSSAGICVVAASNNNILTSNIGISNSNYGICVLAASNNNLTSNTGTSTSSVGIYVLATSNNNILTSNIGISNSNYGISLNDTSSNNILTSNIGTSNSSNGIRLSSLSNNNILTSNIGTSTSSAGIYLLRNSNNILVGNNATGLSTGSYGYYIQNESGTTIRDCLQTSGVAGDVYVHSELGTNLTLINCTYRTTGTNESVNGAGNILIRKWYYQANASDAVSGGVLNGVNITAYNNSNGWETNLTTNPSGSTAIGEITDYVNNGETRSYFSPYNMTASLSGYTILIQSWNASLGNNYSGVFGLSESVAPTIPSDSLDENLGGGSGGIFKALGKTFSLSTEIYDKTIVLGKIESDIIKVTNDGAIEKTFSVSVENLDEIVSVDKNSFSLVPKETHDIKLSVVAPENAGIYVGKIIVQSGSIKKEILVSITLKTENLAATNIPLKVNEKTPVAKKEVMWGLIAIMFAMFVVVFLIIGYKRINFLGKHKRDGTRK